MSGLADVAGCAVVLAGDGGGALGFGAGPCSSAWGDEWVALCDVAYDVDYRDVCGVWCRVVLCGVL